MDATKFQIKYRTTWLYIMLIFDKSLSALDFYIVHHTTHRLSEGAFGNIKNLSQFQRKSAHAPQKELPKRKL